MASRPCDYSVLIVVCVGSLCKEAEQQHYSCQTEYMVSTGIACDLHRICVLYITNLFSKIAWKLFCTGLQVQRSRFSYSRCKAELFALHFVPCGWTATSHHWRAATSMSCLLQLDAWAEYSVEVPKAEARTDGGSVASSPWAWCVRSYDHRCGKSLWMFLAPLAAWENGIVVVIQ